MQEAITKKITDHEHGQSLVEAVIAIAIFSLFAVSMATFILGAITLAQTGGDVSQADALAVEGIEAVRAIRDSSWNNLAFDSTGIGVVDGRWALRGEGTVDEIGKFTRTINFLPIFRNAERDIVSSTSPEAVLDGDSRQVDAVVEWDTGRGVFDSVIITAYLTNWR
jgi:hypothetical protein